MLQSKDTEWLTGFKKKQKPAILCLQETYFRMKDTQRLKVRGCKKIFHANGNNMKVEVATLTSVKIYFKTKVIKKNKEEHYIVIKESIQEESITLINIYAPNIGAPKYIKQILTNIKGEIDNNIIIVGDFNNPLTSTDRLSIQKINKATQ